MFQPEGVSFRSVKIDNFCQPNGMRPAITTTHSLVLTIAITQLVRVFFTHWKYTTVHAAVKRQWFSQDKIHVLLIIFCSVLSKRCSKVYLWQITSHLFLMTSLGPNQLYICSKMERKRRFSKFFTPYICRDIIIRCVMF